MKAVAYDTPIPGYQTQNCISLRLWNAEVSADQFDLVSHNASNYDASVGPATTAFELCAVLYPGDSSREGKALRIKQQYFLCSASLQDIMARYTERAGGSPNWGAFASKVAIQMNDTHPTLARLPDPHPEGALCPAARPATRQAGRGPAPSAGRRRRRRS